MMDVKTISMKTVSSLVILGMVILMAEACSDNNPKPTANYKRYQSTTHKTPAAAVAKKAVKEEPAVPVAKVNTVMPPKAVQAADRTLPAVKSLKLCSAVVDREPADDLTEIDLSLGKIYTHTAISSEQADTVYHVYKFEGQEIARVGLFVGDSPRWRTWSSKRLDPIWIGNWSVEIQSGAGDVLAEKYFTVIDPVEEDEETETLPSEAVSSGSF